MLLTGFTCRGYAPDWFPCTGKMKQISLFSSVFYSHRFENASYLLSFDQRLSCLFRLKLWMFFSDCDHWQNEEWLLKVLRERLVFQNLTECREVHLMIASWIWITTVHILWMLMWMEEHLILLTTIVHLMLEWLGLLIDLRNILLI